MLESEKEPTINRVAEIIFDESARLKEIINGDNEDCIKEFARHLLADIQHFLSVDCGHISLNGRHHHRG